MPEPNTGCWLWTGASSAKGYGLMVVGSRSDGSRRTVHVHRAVFEERHGRLPKSVQVCHKCDTPPCGNIDHLFAGTNEENAADREAKGRGKQPRGEANGNAELDEERVRRIVALRWDGLTLKAIAAAVGVSTGPVEGVLSGKLWKHVTSTLALPPKCGKGNRVKPVRP
jgi:hypothetical protein